MENTVSPLKRAEINIKSNWLEGTSQNLKNRFLVGFCVIGFLVAVRILVKMSADINTDFDAPLFWACYFGRVSTVEFLLASGVDPKKYGSSHMVAAAENGKTDIVEILDSIGEPICKIAIDAAIENGHDEVLIFIEKKAIPFTFEILDDESKND